MLPPCSTDQFTIPLDFCLDWIRTKALGASWLETLFRFSKPALRGFPEVPARCLGLSESRDKGRQTQRGKSQKTRCIVLTTGMKTSHKENRERAREVSQNSATVLWQEDSTTQLWCSRKTTQHNITQHNCGVAGRPNSTTQLCCGMKTTQHNTTMVQQKHHTTQHNCGIAERHITQHNTSVMQQEDHTTQHNCGVVGTHNTTVVQQEDYTLLWLPMLN